MIREAKQAIADGKPRLLLLGTAERFGGALQDGMTVVPISCQSEGALEVYVEPVLPAPHLVIVGGSPMAHVLAGLARALDWRGRPGAGGRVHHGLRRNPRVRAVDGRRRHPGAWR